MAGVNKVILLGNLGKDPEVRFLDVNVSVCTFTMATTEGYVKDGVRVEHTEWHNIVLWRHLADSAAKYLRKGSKIYLEGHIRSRSYEDKEGVRRNLTEIVGESFKLIGRGADSPLGGQQAAPQTPEQKKAEKNEDVDFNEISDDDSGLPF